MIDKMIEIMNNVRVKRPLIECITNKVTINDCANAILAVGASAVMTENENELEDIVKKAKAAVINIGTLSEIMIEPIKLCGVFANKYSVPIVFDPVGVGGTEYRTKTALEFLNTFKPSVIRGNISEVKALLGIENGICGVDSAADDTITLDNYNKFSGIVKELAVKYNCVVCATSAVDIVSDGICEYRVNNGSKTLRNITGAGCITSAICGAYLSENNPISAAVLAVLAIGISGEMAERFVSLNNCGTGTFRVKLIDYLSTFDEKVLKERANIF